METTVTIKYGKGYDDSWAVFKGSSGQIRDQIVDYFGYNVEEVKALTLHELVLNATASAHGTRTFQDQLGAAVAGSGEDPAKESSWSHPQSEQKEEDGNAYLLSEIAACASVADLQTLWAKNQDAFNEDGNAGPLMTAWKARGKALTA